MNDSENCNRCNGDGWIPYIKIVNKDKLNQGYCKDNRKCYHCNGRGSTNKNMGLIGYPGRTGFLLGDPPK